MSKDHETGFVGLEELFGRPLSEVPDEEILAKAQELRTRRKYPSVEKAEGKRKDKVSDLIQGILVQHKPVFEVEESEERILLDDEDEE